MKRVTSRELRRTMRIRRLVLISGVIAVLLTLLLPGPAPASTKKAVVTATVTLSPVEVMAWAPSTVPIGTVFPVEAIIRNRGDSSIDKAVAAIHLPKDVELVGSKTEIKLGTIRAHRFALAIWWVRAPKKGNYAILISASGKYDKATVTGQDVVLVNVRARPR